MQEKNENEFKKQKHSRPIIIGHWLYDNIKPMTVNVFAINFDFWYEIEEKEYRDEKEVEELNEKGERYVFVINCDSYNPPYSIPAGGGLTLLETMKNAERIITQGIKWDEPLTNDYV